MPHATDDSDVRWTVRARAWTGDGPTTGKKGTFFHGQFIYSYKICLPHLHLVIYLLHYLIYPFCSHRTHLFYPLLPTVLLGFCSFPEAGPGANGSAAFTAGRAFDLRAETRWVSQCGPCRRESRSEKRVGHGSSTSGKRIRGY